MIALTSSRVRAAAFCVNASALAARSERDRSCAGYLDLDLPGYRLHPFPGDLNRHWSISISGNWRHFRLEKATLTMPTFWLRRHYH